MVYFLLGEGLTIERQDFLVTLSLPPTPHHGFGFFEVPSTDFAEER